MKSWSRLLIIKLLAVCGVAVAFNSTAAPAVTHSFLGVVKANRVVIVGEDG